jgi:hypothetical protein
MFYLFSAFKGFVMVAVSMLVASGWGVMRPFLTEREKKVLMVALVLQLLANTAIIMTDELSPGSMQYSAWVMLMHIADAAAAVAVIVPVTWSMKQLEISASEAREGDGAAKAAETLARLNRFRNFYIYTISYLYVTRFLVWVLSGVVDYSGGWIPPAFEEAATLAYYIYSGYRFRPAGENAYLRVSQDDDDEAPGDIELGRATGAGLSASNGANVVQTVSAARRDASSAATAEAEVAARGGASTEGAAVRHVIADADDEFGMDEIHDAPVRKGGKGAAAAEEDFGDDDLDLEEAEAAPLRPAPR